VRDIGRQIDKQLEIGDKGNVNEKTAVEQGSGTTTTNERVQHSFQFASRHNAGYMHSSLIP
jgi:hypothetical protein